MFVAGHLIGLLESLGTLSITAIELKQLIGLLESFCYVFVTGHLIGLLESLGTLSITAIELKQLIGLLRLDEEDNQVFFGGGVGS